MLDQKYVKSKDYPDGYPDAYYTGLDQLYESVLLSLSWELEPFYVKWRKRINDSRRYRPEKWKTWKDRAITVLIVLFILALYTIFIQN